MADPLFGKYQITRRLGSGGMAEVYLARDPWLERNVAIKVIHPHLVREKEFEQRFGREAKLVASLRHPSIVHVYEFDLNNGAPFMVMEYLEGGTLKDALADYRGRGQVMPLPEASAQLTAIASALDYAHARGLVHRDLKPANILFTANREPVITDFGIAKILGNSAPITMTGKLLGTPAYMSPEQASGKTVDKQSDIYSLGIILYEMVTGSVPFKGESTTAVMMKHLSEPPPLPRRFNPALPKSAEDVILEALAKNPAQRYPSAGELARAFSAALPVGRAILAPGEYKPTNQATSKLDASAPGTSRLATPSTPPAGQAAPPSAPSAPQLAEATTRIEPATSNLDAADAGTLRQATPPTPATQPPDETTRIEQATTNLDAPERQTSLRATPSASAPQPPDETTRIEQATTNLDAPERQTLLRGTPPAPAPQPPDETTRIKQATSKPDASEAGTLPRAIPSAAPQASAPHPQQPRPSNVGPDTRRATSKLFLGVAVLLILLLVIGGAFVILRSGGTTTTGNGQQPQTASVEGAANSAQLGSGTDHSGMPNSPQAGQSQNNVGLVRFTDGSSHSDQVVVSLTNIPRPAPGKKYEAWLVGKEGESRLSLGKLDVDAQGRGQLTFLDKQGDNLLAQFDRFQITLEPDPDTSPLPSGDAVYSSGIPPGALMHIRHLLTAFDDTPNHIGLAVGLLQDAEFVNQTTRDMLTANQKNDFERVLNDAESLVNIIEGKQGPHYGDHDNNLIVSDPSDGYGLLLNGKNQGYIEGTIDHANLAGASSDATEEIRMHSEHVKIAAKNLEDWSTELRDLGLSILNSQDNAAATESVRKAAALGERFLNGIDTNGNGTIDPIPGEAGARVAYEHALYMADMDILSGPNAMPTSGPK